MRLDELYLWHLGDPATPRYVGALKLVAAGKGVSLHYGEQWLDSGFALSEVVAKIAASESINAVEARIVRAGGSLGGAKPKALIAIGGERAQSAHQENPIPGVAPAVAGDNRRLQR